MQTFEKKGDSKHWKKAIENMEKLREASIKEVHEIKKGDTVLYVGKFLGKVVGNRMVKLRDGTKLGSLDSQPHKFRKVLND